MNKLTEAHKLKISEGLTRHYSSVAKRYITNVAGYVERRQQLNKDVKRKYAHRIIMENHLGRELRRDEIIHHTNGNKSDNRIENMEIMSLSDHARIHSVGNNFGKDRIGIPPVNKTSRETIDNILEMKKGGFTKTQISLKTGLSYQTVRKYWEGEK